jgi:hypothetical protein
MAAAAKHLTPVLLELGGMLCHTALLYSAYISSQL